jgi:hypothetical protein
MTRTDASLLDMNRLLEPVLHVQMLILLLQMARIFQQGNMFLL